MSLHDPRLVHLCILSQLCNSFVTTSIISRGYSVHRTRDWEESLLTWMNIVEDNRDTDEKRKQTDPFLRSELDARELG